MKKIFWILSVFILTGLCGCSNRNLPRWFQSEQDGADHVMRKIAEACNTQDTEKMMKLFSESSKKKLPDLEEEIRTLFQYLEGNQIIDFQGDCASSGEKDRGKGRIEWVGMYELSASDEEYSMNFYMYPEDEENPQNVGIYKIEIATAEETEKADFMWNYPEIGVFIAG
mgnify:FL=1